MRAVIYCRTSTAEEVQLNALEKQIEEAKACVNAQAWSLVDNYIETASGTTTKGREQYNRLYADLLTDKFDVIVIKSQDRLMRNVKDWYLFLDRMQTHGKRLFIYIEQKFYQSDDALITGIKAILAEEYSRELSKKINNAHRNRQKKGKVAVITSRTLGYRKCPDGSVEIVESEAEMIRLIFSYAAEGYGSRTIANLLHAQGKSNQRGVFPNAGSVRRVLKNPLYKGIAVMNRLHYDFDSKKTLPVPEEEWIYCTGAVPAIVEEDLWQRANDQISRRARQTNRTGVYKKGSNPGKYQLSGKLVCGKCGSPYYRVSRVGKYEPDTRTWCCKQYVEYGRKGSARKNQMRRYSETMEEGCDNVHIEEKVLIQVLESVSKQYFDWSDEEKGNVMKRMLQLLQQILEENPVSEQMAQLEKREAGIKKKKEVLLSKLLDDVISDADYQKKNREFEEQLEAIREKREGMQSQLWERTNVQERINKIRDRLMNGGMEQASVYRMLEDVDKIVVNEWTLDIYFDPLKIAGFDKEDSSSEFFTRLSNQFTITVNYPFGPETERGRYLDRRTIVQRLKEKPDLTCKRLAEEMGRSPYMIRNRIEELERGGYIRYEGKGGRGKWQVLMELPDKEESIKIRGL